MNLSSKMIIVLTSVGLITGAFLAAVGILTTGPIAFNKQQEIKAAIVTVIPGTTQSEKLYEEKDLTIYSGKDASGTLIGYAIYATGSGFQDKITLMFGTSISFTRIIRLTILEQLETPGLGAKIKDRDAFLLYWENKDCTQTLSLRKPAVPTPEDLLASEVNTITGATISSQAVLDTVNLSLARLKSLKTEGKLLNKEQNAN